MNTLNDGPFASHSSARHSPLNNGGIQNSKGSSYLARKAPRNKAPGYAQPFHEEEPTPKRRRVQDTRETRMSKDKPIVIPDDDIEMGERDELAHSSDKDPVSSQPTKRPLFTRSTKPTNKTIAAITPRIPEYHAVEDMMNSSKPHIHPARPPLQVLQSHDSCDEELSSKSSADEELFTKQSKQKRIEAKGEAKGERESETTQGQETNGNLTAPEARAPRTPEVPKGIFYTSPARPANSESESPDVLQMARERTLDGGRSSQVPLHQSSGSNLANTIIRGGDLLSSQIGRLKSKASSRKARHPAGRGFRLRQLRFGALPKDFDYMITIDEDQKTLSIRPQSQILEDEMTIPIPLRRVSNIHHGENGCTQVMLVMSRTEGAIDDKMHLELESDKEVYDFVTTVQRLAGGKTNVDTKKRHVVPGSSHLVLSLISLSNWLQKALERHEQPKTNHKATAEPEEATAVTNLRQPALVTPAHPVGSGISRSTRTHDRYTDRLESSHATSTSKPGELLSGATTIITGKDRATNAAGDSTSNEGDPSAGSKRGISSMLKGSVSKYFTPRATRSSTVNSVAPDRFDADTAQPKFKLSQTGEQGTPWKKPLVYSKTGKKRETVDFQDLERLDDDEFLNDNLIGFYLGYLEHYLEKEKPEVAKKVYFFNSYFFARLTQTQKGVKGINYAAVQKWTRTVDIFSRDFVVVPVNENLHWYVAIICNLPNLRRQLADDDDEVESIATSETVPAAKGDGNGEEAITEEQVEEPDGKTRSSFAGLSLGDEGKSPLADGEPPITTSNVKPQSSPKPKKGPGRRKSARRSLIKIDPHKPVVITLDSLGLSRTVTRTALKDYIIEEGKSKRSLNLERGDLEGVTAKGIPTQKNYSDCGLFLCAYMERFVMDPYRFVHNILQRDMNEANDWPMMSSNELRSRLRNVIMELHRHQEGEKELVPIPDVGRILLCSHSVPPPRQVSEPDLQEVEPNTRNALVDLADEEAASQVNAELTAAADVATQPPSSPELSQGAALKSAEDAVNRPSPGISNSAVRRTPEVTIVIPDSPDLPAPRHMSSKFRSHVNVNDDLIDGLENLDGDPQALAKRLRRDRGPTKAQGQVRSQSVTTDFMSGLQSYAREPSPSEMPGGWDDGEVPETQCQENVAGDIHKEEDDLSQETLKSI